MRTITRMTLAAGCATALASVPLGAVYSSYRWLWYAWAAVAAVMISALAVRSLRLPAFVVPIAGVLGLAIYLTVVFASGPALFGFVPTAASIDALRLGVVNGLADVRDLATPVPPTPGLVILTAGSIGLLAIVVDLIAVILRRPAAAGLALLGLYAVPTAVAQSGVPWPLFVIGASGYLLLLLVEGRDRLLRWGRPVGSTPGGSRFGRVVADDEDAPLPLTGQRIGAAAIAIAVVAPLLVPGLTANALSKIGRTGVGDPSQSGHGVALDPFAALKGRLQQPQPQELFQVRIKQGTAFYLRSVVLDRYTPAGWVASSPVGSQGATGQLDLARGVPADAPRTSYRATITITNPDLNDKYIPTYFAVTDVSGLPPGGWQYDANTGIVFSNADRTQRYSYTIAGVDQRPGQDELQGAREPAADDSFVRTWGQVPASVPAAVKNVVATIVHGANGPYEKAVAIDNYFTDGTQGFTYSLQTQLGDSGNALVDFLTKKQGFCEQYAAAMAIMLRVAGVPSRVVEGYTAGQRVGDYLSIGTQDAHAWVEAYFVGAGWTPFDPTPLIDGRSVALPYAPHASASVPQSSTSAGATAGGPGRSARPPNKLDTKPGADLGGGGSSGRPGLLSPRTAAVGVAGLILLTVLLTPGIGRLAQRRRRLRAAGADPPAAAAGAAWDELVATATDYAVTLPPADTPRSTASRLLADRSLAPPAVAGLRLIALAEERARYAPRAGVDGDLPTAVRAARRGLRAGVRPGRRWRAAVLPPSTLADARLGLARRSARMSASLGRLTAAVRALVPPRRLAGRRRSRPA